VLLWRAVDQPERLDIESVERFRLRRGGMELKYFAETEDGAARMAFGLMQITGEARMWIAVAEAPDRLRAERFADVTPHGAVSVLAVRAADLRKLGPARIIKKVER
jgi:hypothetical protein